MKHLFFSVVALLFVNASIAAGSTFETGKDGLVIKEGRCSSTGNYVYGIAVNRTAQMILGNLEISVLDSEGDFLWRGLMKLNVGPQNGQNVVLAVGAGNCGGKRLAFRFLD